MAKRILIADDSVTIQRAFAMVFTGQDVAVLPARSLDEALTVARREKPEVVVADLALGNRTGYDLCSAIKADGGLRGTTVLLLGSTHHPIDDAKVRQVGADGSLTKPFDSQVVIDKIQELLSRAPAAAPAPSPRAPSPRAPAPSPQSTASAVPQIVPPARDRTQRVDDADIEEEYGEFTLERTPTPPPAAARPKPAAPIARPTPAPQRSPGGVPRPSLIPGVNPAAVPPRRPAAPAPQPIAPAAASPVRPQPIPSIPLGGDVGRGSAMSRTLMGMPAANAAAAAAAAQARGAGAPASTGPVPTRPQQTPGSGPTSPSIPAPFGPPDAKPERNVVFEQKVSDKVDQKLAQIAARGPEYEAIAKLSREIIEQVVWEVVPELAEVIIRQEVDRLASAKNKMT